MANNSNSSLSSATVSFAGKTPTKLSIKKGVIKTYTKDNKEHVAYVPYGKIFKLENSNTFLELCSDGAYREINPNMIGLIAVKNYDNVDTIVGVRKIVDENNINDEVDNFMIQLLTKLRTEKWQNTVIFL